MIIFFTKPYTHPSVFLKSIPKRFRSFIMADLIFLIHTCGVGGSKSSVLNHWDDV